MGFVHDRQATHLPPQTVVEEVFGSDASTSTGMHPGPRLDRSELFGHMNRGLIASIAIVLSTDDKIKDLDRQRERIARDQGGETPLLVQVANELRARLDAERADGMKHLAAGLGMGEQGFPSVDLSALMAEREERIS